MSTNNLVSGTAAFSHPLEPKFPFCRVQSNSIALFYVRLSLSYAAIPHQKNKCNVRAQAYPKSSSIDLKKNL
jgi:hypothetical protein